VKGESRQGEVVGERLHGAAEPRRWRDGEGIFHGYVGCRRNKMKSKRVFNPDGCYVHTPTARECVIKKS
jgi:hypothetical protein